MTFGGYTANDIAMFVGAICAALGIVVQIAQAVVKSYYLHQEFKLKKLETEARIAAQGYYGDGQQ